MKFVTGGIMHETHTFSTVITTEADYATRRDSEVLVYAGTNHSTGGVIDGCRDRGIELIHTLQTKTVTSGPPSQATFERMVDELARLIGKALPADGIVLTLHGAMVAEGYPDAELEILRRVRAVTGPELPIAVTLDFHANISTGMVELADIIVGYETYPHIDLAARAREAVDLLAEVVDGTFTPAMKIVRPPLLPVPQAQHTSSGPFRKIFERVREIKRSGAARSITVAGGFAYSDIPIAGMSVIGITDNDPESAEGIARELAELAWSLRQEMLVANTAPDGAVREAIALGPGDGPVILVDVSDNIGAGSPGDGTALLHELLAQNATDATIIIADAEAAAAAAAVGVGGQLRIDVGGKVDRMHGEPVAIDGSVRLLCDGKWVHEGPENAGVPVDSGPTAVVRAGGVNVVLTSRKTAPGDLQQLKSIGIDPLRQRIIVVKSAVRWRGGYEPIARHAIHVDTPGICGADLSRLPFQHVPRPIFPLDRDCPWERSQTPPASV
jgi:microcystin degradation protein MlrC